MARTGPTKVVALFALCLALTSCGRDATAPNTVLAPTAPAGLDKGPGRGSDDDPDFLESADDAPAIANPVIVFTAVKGRDATVRMLYERSRHGRHGGGDDLFAEFRVSEQSLAFRPDGRPFADGESVQITMRLVDAVHGIIDFQPSGLRFSARDPARLKISYAHADADLNKDGVVDARDAVLRRGLHMICRETPTSPWTPVPSINDSGDDVVNALILGFSGYAIEY